jgi:hypothetical protein
VLPAVLLRPAGVVLPAELVLPLGVAPRAELAVEAVLPLAPESDS